MTKLISALIIIAVLFVGWRLFIYWDQVKAEEDVARKKAAAAVIVSGEQLPGLPHGLEASLRAAEQQGAAGLRAWLKTYGNSVQDPRKGWIELDYCIALSRENPAEARRVFAEVKRRTPKNSPLMPRLRDLEKTYQ